VPHKGVHVLIDAFNRVVSNYAFLMIYGSGQDESYISNLRHRAKDHNTIRFCGMYSNDKVGEILSNVVVIMIPSLWYENTPLVLGDACLNISMMASIASFSELGILNT